MQHIDMEKFANGAFTEQINRELKKVTENIQDPNTDATAKRRITVVIEFKPNEARNFVTTGVQAKSTLAPALGAVTALSMGKNIRTNEVEAVEIGSQIPGQMTIEEVTDSFDESGSAEGMREDKSKVRYRIDIWDFKNTSPTAVAVDKAVSDLGLKRIGCADVPDPSGMKHKQMRYEGIIDMDSDQVYWLN